MSRPKNEASRIKILEGKLQEAKAIFQAIQFMELSESFPARLKEAIAKQLQ